MKTHFKKMLGMVSLSVLLLIGTAAPVSGGTGSDVDEYQQAAELLIEVMKQLDNDFLGSDIGVEQLLDGAMYGMFDSLKDPYSVYFDKKEFEAFDRALQGNSYIIGLSYELLDSGQFVIREIIKNSPAEKAGIKAGSILNEINGTSLQGLSVEDVIALIADEDVLKVVLTYNGKESSYTLKREVVKRETVYYKSLEGNRFAPKGADLKNVGYIAIDAISVGTDKELKIAIDTLKKNGVNRIILDLRGNSGGYQDVMERIGNMLVPKGVICYTVDRNGIKKTYSSRLEKLPFDKMVVLVDGETASAAEVLVAALQDAKAATIVGQTTYGKGVTQSFNELEGKGGFKYTNSEILSRNGRRYNNIGIVPDVVVSIPEYLSGSFQLHNDNTVLQMDKIKSSLQFLGYETGELNLVNDEKTVASLKAFQKSKGLVPTGMVDVETIGAINEDIFLVLQENDVTLTKGIEVLIGTTGGKQ